MGALRNPKRERFAIERASGKPRMEAMRLAGYVPAEANARKIDNSPDIKARVTELYKLHADYLSADIARVLIEQTRIAYSNIADLLNPDGSLKNISIIPREVMAAVKELKFDKDGHPHIKLHDKAGALAALQRYLDPDPLPPGQRLGDTPTQPETPAYVADDDWTDLTKPPPAPVSTH